MFSRRRFLQISGALSLTPFVPKIAGAVSGPPAHPGQFFLLVRLFGGADVTLGLDPWTKPTLPAASDMFVEYRPEDLIDLGPEFKLGPAAAALKKHAGTFSVVNGVFLSQVDNGHDASMMYMCSGSTHAAAPTLPVEVARATAEGDYGVLNNFGLQMGNRVVGSSNLDDLKLLPNQADLSAILQTIFVGGTQSGYLDAVRRVMGSRILTQDLIEKIKAFGAPESLTENQVLAAAFSANAATCAQLDVRNNALDTHAGHAGAHLAAQTTVWNRIDEIFTLFKNTPYGTMGESLFDRTTFMVMSEFARTPALNGAGGKDHNPMTNSILIGGRGIHAGKVVGASRLVTAAESPTQVSYHIAYPIDYSTGEVQRSRTPVANMIFPENVAQTVATAMNVDRKIFQSLPAETLPLAVLLKS